MLRFLPTTRGVACLLVLVCWVRPGQTQVPPPPPAGPVTYQTFYDTLSPYGQWVDDPDYGYSWVPAVGVNFQPYRTSGHWVYSDYGWTWVSDYAWGWAPFHYGRWRYSDGYGWLWVPGYRWGPAWVAWRQSAGYYGWAPLGPPPVRSGSQVSIGLSFSFGDAPVAPARWCFVPAAYVASPRIATYYVPPTQTTVVYNQTTVIQNTYVNKQVNVRNTTIINNNGPRRDNPGFPAGPARADVERATGHPLQQLAVTSRATPGVGVQGQALAFYRPDVAAPTGAPGRRGAPNAPAAPAPRTVVPLADAVRQARQHPRPADAGLLPSRPAQQLNSTDAHPFRDARAPDADQPTPASPATADRRRNHRLNQLPDNNLGGQPAAGARPDPQPASAAAPQPDQTARDQPRQQRQQQQNQPARMQQAARTGPDQPQRQPPPQNQPARHQRPQDQQAQRPPRPPQQPARLPRQERPHPGRDGERHR